MSLDASWRLFRRMQTTILVVAILAFGVAAIDAWPLLPGGGADKSRLALLTPCACMALTFAIVLLVPAPRRVLGRHLLIAYSTGFGQSVISVLTGVAAPILIAGLIVWQAHHARAGSARYVAGAFAGFGAGIGLLAGQAVLARRLERDVRFRAHIERP
jgi:hypothetical protein